MRIKRERNERYTLIDDNGDEHDVAELLSQLIKNKPPAKPKRPKVESIVETKVETKGESK